MTLASDTAYGSASRWTRGFAQFSSVGTMSAKVAVTGANGHVGANLVRALLAQGRRVRALEFDGPESLTGLEVERVVGDLRDVGYARRALAGCEVVYHLAGVVALHAPRKLYDEVNVKAVANVVEACVANGVRRLVHVSSVHAMVEPLGGTTLGGSRPLVANDHPHDYSRSKAEGERLVVQATARGLEVVVLAPTAIYGPHDYACSPLTRLLVDLYKKRWPVLVDCGYDLVDVRDVVEVAMEAEQHAPSGSKYQVAGHFVSFRELARLVASIAGVKSSPICVPPWGGLAVAYAAVALSKMTGSLPVTTPASVRVVSNKHRRFSHARATQELGYQPRSPRDSLSTTLCWLRDSGMLRGASDS